MKEIFGAKFPDRFTSGEVIKLTIVTLVEDINIKIRKTHKELIEGSYLLRC